MPDDLALEGPASQRRLKVLHTPAWTGHPFEQMLFAINRCSGGLRRRLPAMPDRTQHNFFDPVGHGCHHQAHQPSLDTPEKWPLRNAAHDVNSE
jgi:hypothetical protein